MSNIKSKPVIQPKVTVIALGFMYKKEANTKANKIMHILSNETPKPIASLTSKSLQKKCSQYEKEENLLFVR